MITVTTKTLKNSNFTPLTKLGYSFIKNNPGTSLAKMAAGIGCSTRTAFRIKNSLIDSGHLYTRVKRFRGKKWRTTIK